MLSRPVRRDYFTRNISPLFSFRFTDFKLVWEEKYGPIRGHPKSITHPAPHPTVFQSRKKKITTLLLGKGKSIFLPLCLRLSISESYSIRSGRVHKIQ